MTHPFCYIHIIKFVPKVMQLSKYVGDFAYAYGLHKQMGKISKKITRIKEKFSFKRW